MQMEMIKVAAVVKHSFAYRSSLCIAAITPLLAQTFMIEFF